MPALPGALTLPIKLNRPDMRRARPAYGMVAGATGARAFIQGSANHPDDARGSTQ
jgi:hypothetical protein